MTVSEIEKNMKKRYPVLFAEISKLIDLCIEKTNYISQHRREWIDNQDSRFAVYGKYISSLNSTRILLYQCIEFLSKKNWEEIYNLNFSIGGLKDEFEYLRELNRQIMFASYLSFVSEFESSIAIIYRHLNNKGGHFATNYKGFIIDNLKISSQNNLIDIIKHSRNTIHNNGLHIPENSNHNNITLNFKSLKIDFHRNKTVLIEWKEFLTIYNEIIILTDLIIHHKEVVKETEIRDIVLDA